MRANATGIKRRRPKRWQRWPHEASWCRDNRGWLGGHVATQAGALMPIKSVPFKMALSLL